jgi:uncharacterized RDD family membrane protein YckC
MTTSQPRPPKSSPEPPSGSAARFPAPPPPPPNWPAPWESQRLTSQFDLLIPPPQFGRFPPDHHRQAPWDASAPLHDPGTLAVPTPTPRAARIPAPLARFGRRTVSFLIDWVLPVAVLNLLLPLAAPPRGTPSRLVIDAMAYLALVGFGIWNSGYLQGATGRSIGRRVAGTKLVSIETGQPVGVRRALARQICHVLDIGIGCLWPLRDRKRQTFTDKIFGTVVVRTGGLAKDRAGAPGS